jgi:predicted unusual protein kinase regulating ubiquinone biosynthesis (AarF/ABC1/UbiB family)
VADEIKRGSARRNAKLASIPMGMAGRAALGAAKRLTGKSRDEVNAELMEKAADQLFSVLGELKGGAMKVGQALSVLEAAIPEEYGEPYREALTKLQKDAPPLSADKVHRVLDTQLGTKWRERFTSFDDTPVASASIGQVHKAVWHDGRAVAVKIQYPGADEALRADLKTMRRLTSVLKQLASGADVQGVVDELVERTEMELDYRLEADHQRAFARAYEGHPRFVVPHVVGSAPKVMVSEWIDGKPMSAIIRNGTVDERDICGTRLFELTFDAPARVGMMHGDAHPGNFMLLPDQRLAVLDFGAVAPLPDGLPVEMGQMIRLARDKKYDELLPAMEKVGFVRPGEQLPPEAIDDMLAQYVEPITVPVFHYTRKWLQKQAAASMERTPQNLRVARQMDLPASLAIPLRVIGSTVAISAQLDCHVPVREMAEKLIPGFADPA